MVSHDDSDDPKPHDNRQRIVPSFDVVQFGRWIGGEWST
jgi:hypothetical protein